MENYHTKRVDDAGSTIYEDAQGRWHRTDGPAIECKDSAKYWYIHGKRHRTDGPSIIRASGTQVWNYNDLMHREDGPAVTYHDGVSFYFHGVYAKTHHEFYDAAWRKEVLLRQVK